MLPLDPMIIDSSNCTTSLLYFLFVQILFLKLLSRKCAILQASSTTFFSTKERTRASEFSEIHVPGAPTKKQRKIKSEKPSSRRKPFRNEIYTNEYDAI